MFAQILFKNLSEDKDCIRSSSPRHETKLHGIDVNLSSYDGASICPITFIPYLNTSVLYNYPSCSKSPLPLQQFIMYNRLQSLGILHLATTQFTRWVMAKILSLPPTRIISTFKPDGPAAFPLFIFVSALLTILVVILIQGPQNSCSLDKVLLSQENSTLISFSYCLFQAVNFDWHQKPDCHHHP